MGSFIEINDILQITEAQGFPSDLLNLERHLKNPIQASEFEGKIFEFKHKSGARIFHRDPIRVFLVQNIDGKWLFWGKAFIQSQTIRKKLDDQGNWINEEWETSGTYIISEIYGPDYQRLATIHESLPGLSYY